MTGAKKLLIIFFSVLILGLLPVCTCFAGDVPEGLLYDENNPLYIWKITEQNTETLKIENTDDMSKRMEE